MGIFGRRRPRANPLQKEALLREQIARDAQESAQAGLERSEELFTKAVANRSPDAAEEAASQLAYGMVVSRKFAAEGPFPRRPDGMSKTDYDAQMVELADRRREAGAPHLVEVRKHAAAGDIEAARAALDLYAEAILSI